MIREKIRMRMKELGLPFCKVALEAEIRKDTFSSFLHGQRGLKVEKVEKLFEMLDLTLVPRKGFTFERKSPPGLS